MTICERMRNLRKNELHMSMEEFGKILGISKSGISEIEAGRRNVTEQHIRLLTNTPINGKMVNEEWLRSGTGEMFTEKSAFSLDDFADANHLTNLEKEIVRNFMSLDKETKNAIYSIFAKAALSVNVPEENDVKEAEDAYIKSRSDSAQKMELSASNITGDTSERKEA